MIRKRDGSTASDDDPTLDAGTRWAQVAQRHFDPDRDRELVVTVVFAIAEARGVDPTEVRSPPLYECVDLAALEETFFGPDVAATARQGSGAVEFRYEEFLVKVRSDGWAQVYEERSA